MTNKHDKLFEIFKFFLKFFEKRIIMKKLKVILQFKKVLKNKMKI